MNKRILSCGWHLMISFSFGAFTPLERPIEWDGLDALVGNPTRQEPQTHHSTLLSPPLIMERNLDNMGINDVIAHHEGNKEPKNKIQERIKALEVFVTLNDEFEYHDHETYLASFRSKLVMITELPAVWNWKAKISDLCSSAVRYPKRIRFIAKALMQTMEKFAGNFKVLTNGGFEKFIVDVLEFLQNEDLESYERLWILSVLKLLQSFWPLGRLKLIREDPNTGGVCRGGLELFLLKGLDYRPRVKGIFKGRKQIFPEDEAVTEALKRVELILTIKNYILDTKRNLQSTELIKIHDQLLQNRSLSKRGVVESLASQSIHHTFLEDTPIGEIECFSQIMQHLESFYPVSKSFGITEASRRAKLIIKIRIYLQDCDRTHQRPAIINTYDKLLRTKSMDDALIVRSLVLEILQHMDIQNNPESDEDIECLYDILQYLETLYPNSQQFKLTEPLNRVQLMMNIRNHLHDAESTHQSTVINDIHDTLLQTSSLDKDEIIKSMSSKCIHHMFLGNPSDGEAQCFYHILEYLKKFHTTTIQMINYWLSTSKPFRKMYHKFQLQAELQPHLQRYFEKEDKDPYIMSLLLPSVGWHSVKPSYVEHCLHILNIQDSALASKKGELYGLDGTKGEKYHDDQDFFIEIMYKASAYIEGLQQSLDMQVQRNEQSGHYEFKSCALLTNQLETTDKCRICLGGYKEGQRVLKLGCYRPHLFHEQCMNGVVLESGGVDVKCPTCRRDILTPFAQEEHIFWGI